MNYQNKTPAKSGSSFKIQIVEGTLKDHHARAHYLKETLRTLPPPRSEATQSGLLLRNFISSPYNGESNEQKVENEMETGGIQGFKELNLSYYIGETTLLTIYTYYGNLV